jgi:hypothetical protein
MQWDLGPQGLGLLILTSLGFGVIAQFVAERATTRWLWVIAGARLVPAEHQPTSRRANVYAGI